MNDTPVILIVIGAILAVLGLCVLLGGILCAAAKAEPPINSELDIPQDREFIEPREADFLGTDYTPCTSGPANPRPQIPKPVFGKFEEPTFPHDASYASHKRF